jgi:hypothetical protein
MTASPPLISPLMMVVEGHHEGARADVDAAVPNLADLLRAYSRPASARES